MKNAIQVRHDDLEVRIHNCINATFLGHFGREPIEFEQKCMDDITNQLSMHLEAKIDLGTYDVPGGCDLQKPAAALVRYLILKGYTVERFNNRLLTVKVSDHFIQSVLTYNSLKGFL